jgi:hypothetical protein
MHQPDTNDPLDKLLQEQNTHIEDAGFTARVVSSLPVPSRWLWLRPVLLLGVSVTGSILAVRWLPWNSLASIEGRLDAATALPWIVVLTVFACLVWGMISALQIEDGD